jgi:hypothetical protein
MIDLQKLKEKLLESLRLETKESLEIWLKRKREKDGEKMSGGSLEYASFAINRIIENLESVEDEEVKTEIEETIKELQRMSNNLYQLEWYLSGDIGIESMQLNWQK